MAQPATRTHPWRSTLRREAGAATTALGRAPRAVVVREVALQVVAAGFNLAGTAVGATPLTVALSIPATALVLLVRLRWPAAATGAAGVLLAPVAPGALVAAPLVGFRAGRRASSQRRLLLVLAVGVALCVAVAPVVPTGEGLLVDLVGAGVVAAALLGVPAACGALLGERRPEAQLLAERNDHLERARSLMVAQARLGERARITGEMHDLLGHRLSLLSVHAGALEVHTAHEAPRLSEHAHLVRTTAVTALDELRATLEATRATTGLPAADLGSGSREEITALAEDWCRAGVDVDVTWHEEVDGPLNPRVGRAVDRTVREGLTNAHKHAPGTPVTVGVRRTERRVRTTVRNGAPEQAAPGAPGTRLGLLGLTERARLLGGTAAWGPTEEGGFVVVVDVPARPSTAPDPAWALAPASLPSPSPVREADVLTWRRVAVVALLATVLALPLALVLAATVVIYLLP